MHHWAGNPSLRVSQLSFKGFNLNPLTPMSDQDIISPYNIDTISSKQVIRIKKNIN